MRMEIKIIRNCSSDESEKVDKTMLNAAKILPLNQSDWIKFVARLMGIKLWAIMQLLNSAFFEMCFVFSPRKIQPNLLSEGCD